MSDSAASAAAGESSVGTQLSSIDKLQISEPTHDDSEKKKQRKKKRSTASKAKVNRSNDLLESTSFPWKVSTVKNRGRCAVATRVIKPGEVVVAERAIAFVPRAQYRKAICHICGIDLAENAPRTECASCGYTIFCETCVEPPQGSHEKHCGVYKEIDDIAMNENCDADLLRLVFNLALKKTESTTKTSEDDTSVEECYKNGIIHSSFQDAVGLQTHREKAPVDWVKAVRNGATRLHKLACTGDNAPASCTIEDLEMLATLVNTNAHGMGAQGIHNTDVALGIFPFVSILNHSCRPNCCFASDGSVMYVRAVQDIPKGTELCLSYINLYESRRVRKAQLSATKHFDCTCNRCMEPLKESVDRFLEGCVCHVRGCGGVMVRTSSLHVDQPDSKTWECVTCSRMETEKPWDIVQKAEERLVEAVQVYGERRYREARKLLESFLSEFSGKLHELHVLLFDALTPLMNCCRAQGDAEEGLRVCKLIIQCMDKVLPGPSLEQSNFYFCLGEMYVQKAEAFSNSPVISRRSAKQAQDAFQRVKAIRDICIGKPILPA